MAEKDYYGILGVAKDASEKDIKMAYRKLAREHHPDVNKADKASEERFKEINEAYSVLSDKEKRAKYDQFGQYWEHAGAAGGYGPGPGGGGGYSYNTGGGRVNVNFEDLSSIFGGGGGARGADFSDIFGDIFARGGATRGGGFQDFAQREAPPQDVEGELEITLDEAVSGGTRMVNVQRQDACPRCKGTGRSGKTLCIECHGSGEIASQRKLEVTIPKGVRPGTKIRVRGEGGIGPSGKPRDLYLVVKFAPHPNYEVKGDDLYTEVPVSVTEAVLGAEIRFSTLRGTASMVVPPGSQPNRLFRLSGQGLPGAGNAKAGDLYVKLRNVVPTNLNPEEKQLYQRLAELRPENPRAPLSDSRGK
ncbi:MAG: J domain-containing protein [Armatimonadetes bacterium]|nr:J domain-containing protein [Armatimonadota bacterium]